MSDKEKIGFIQGVVYSCGHLAADCDEPAMALDLWNQTGFTHQDAKFASEYDLAKFRKAIPGLPKGIK